MQKILFYQTRKPKTADGLWMHKDADGNMKLDYVSNGRVKPLGYMNSEAGGGSASGDYKAYIMLNPSSEVRETAKGVAFTNAADAAQALGISEQDFLKFFSDQMPTSAGITNGVWKVFLNLVEHVSSTAEGYIIGKSTYSGSTGSIGNKTDYVIEIEAQLNKDDEQEYYIYMEVTQPIG